MKRGIQDPESIGDHMYRMGLMALVSSDMPGVNRDKLVCYCLFLNCFEYNVAVICNVLLFVVALLLLCNVVCCFN